MADVGTVAHATTLMTNAVITRTGPPVALLITDGFRDTLFIGREHRYDMYDVRLVKPTPPVRRRDVFSVPERTLVDGTIHRPLDEPAVTAIAAELRRRSIADVAVCLLHAYRYPRHEQRVRDVLHALDPRLRVTLSHEVVGELREYERASTTVINAYVLNLADRYLRDLRARLEERGHTGSFFVMLSSGALATVETARRFPVRLIESGPAAGALAAAEAGRRIGRPDLLSFDMGGTTAKACLVQDGQPAVTGQLEVARLDRFHKGSGLPLLVPSVDLIEIGAGGGSLARVDRFGLLQVGPDSAGSDPGPVSYGRGGTTPTVTDANLVLGYLDPDFFLGGRMRLDREAAECAIAEQVAKPLGIDLLSAAWAIHELVNEQMANAARVHAVERGTDLRQLPLYAFGGAGPAHAWRVASNLGMRLVIVPPGAGVGSAVGLLAAPLAFDFVRTRTYPIGDIDWAHAEEVLRDMEDEGRLLLRQAGLIEDQMTPTFAVDMRLAGQAYEVTVDLADAGPHRGDEGRLSEQYSSTYRNRFGRPPPPVPMEVVNWRVRVSGPPPVFPLRQEEGATATLAAARKATRSVYLPERGGLTETAVFDRSRLPTGVGIVGPAIVEEPESTIVVGSQTRASLDPDGNLIVELAS
jgi:N-methylhydantoinase A